MQQASTTAPDRETGFLRDDAPLDRPRLAAETEREARRTRRHPNPSQFDWFILRRIVEDLRVILSRLDGRTIDALDLFCGARPYEGLLPAARWVGMDVDNHYGTSDVVSQEFLPFADESFDLILCTQAFHYLRDTSHAVAELRRVLRPGGAVVLTVSGIWEWDRRTYEARYTNASLAALFDGWDEVQVVENGGYAVTWTAITGRVLKGIEELLAARGGGRIFAAVFTPVYLALNAIGALLHKGEKRYLRSPFALAPNLLLFARRPSDG